MRSWLSRIHRHRYFLLFILLFAYVQSIYMRITVWQHVNAYTFTPDAALSVFLTAGVLFAILLFFIRKWQHSENLTTPELLKIFGSSLLTHLAAMKLISLVIALAFDNVERNFNPETFFISSFSNLLDGFTYGSFFLAYYYYRKTTNQQQQMASYNQALAESRIGQLKAQLNPHFLFNNLNVLDQLIQEDKYQASTFLNEFADIYRYVLQASEKKLVPLQDELDFARQYFNLIRHKYGEAYQLSIDAPSVSGFIVPLTLQLLIENAIQHNLGSSTQPILIRIRIGERMIISNNIIPKSYNKPLSRRALNNLKEQYTLLADTPVDIHRSDEVFTVFIPIVHQKQHD